MKHFNVQYRETDNQWIICEGDETETCAGTWETQEEAENLAELLNATYEAQ